MNKTVQVFKNLYTLRSYNRVFSSKYCTSHKNGKDSREKDCTFSETRQESVVQENRDSEQKINVESKAQTHLLPEEKLAISEQTITDRDSKFVCKVDTVKSDTESDKSSAKGLSDVKKGKSLGVKLEQLIHQSDIEIHSTSESQSDFDLADELLSHRISTGTEHEDIKSVEKSKLAVPDETKSFASLLRRSAFIDLGDPVGKLVVGEIYLVVDNDLYIDFGWKFPAVCCKPKENPEIYNIGAKVLLKIKDLELTARFLGEKEYTSLLEADCELVYRINENGTKYIKHKQTQE